MGDLKQQVSLCWDWEHGACWSMKCTGPGFLWLMSTKTFLLIRSITLHVPVVKSTEHINYITNWICIFSCEDVLIHCVELSRNIDSFWVFTIFKVPNVYFCVCFARGRKYMRWKAGRCLLWNVTGLLSLSMVEVVYLYVVRPHSSSRHERAERHFVRQRFYVYFKVNDHL